MNVGKVVEVEITGVAHGGDGIGRVDGMVCFVMGAFPGDTVRTRIYRASKRAVWGRLHEIVIPSPFRIEPNRCSGKACSTTCSWYTFAYPAQAEWKQQIVRDTLERIGKVVSEVRWLETPELRTGYRTRAIFHGNGLRVGYYEHHTHNVVFVEACPLNHERLNRALGKLHRCTGVKGDVHITVNPEGEEELVFVKRHQAGLESFFPLLNTPKDAQRHWFIFDGVPIVNGGFSQSSLLLNRMLRRHVDACIGTPNSLLDLYCGSGNFSLPYSKHCKVLGIDHAEAAIIAAQTLAPGCYIQGNESVMQQFLNDRSWDVVLLDPPRTGAFAIAPALRDSTARRLVYVSCNPASLARDLHVILLGGWHLIRTTVIDMFPYTPHMEAVCVLEHNP